MNLLAKVELKTTELPDALEFIVIRERSVLETFGIPAITILVMWAFFWRSGNLWLRIVSGLAVGTTILAVLTNWIQGRETQLRVTDDGVIAKGNLGQFFSTSVSIAIRDISCIGHYDGGGENGVPGLYVRHGLKFLVLLPHLSQEQSQSVLDAIARKLPGIPAENLLTPTLFEDRGELISLDLSESSGKRRREARLACAP